MRAALVPLVLTALLAGCGGVPGEVDGGEGGGGPGGGAGGGAAGGSGGGTAGGGGAAVGPSRYPFHQSHSPLTPAVAANLRAIGQRGAGVLDDVFSKVGDSNTVNSNFLSCFAGVNVDLAGRTALQPTLDFFKAGTAGTTTPFDRTSLAATVGWRAASALAGSPSPLEQEWAAVHPRYATVMFGTNDIQFNDLVGYGANLFALVDTLTAKGTVPLLTSIPPRDDSAAADAWVPRYNAVALGVAQARQVPFIDLHQRLAPLPAHGLGSDGLHLNVYAPGGARGCAFTAAGLAFGHNTRNLLTLQSLDRARAAVSGAAAPDSPAPALAGAGSFADPFLVPGLPFADFRDTRVGAANRIGTYPGCSTADESGPEFLYKLTLTQTTNLRAVAVSLGGADLDVHLLDATASAAGCVARSDKQLTAALAPGTWYLSVDTYVTGAGALPGEVLLVVLAD